MKNILSFDEWIKTDKYLNAEITDCIMVNRDHERYSVTTPFGIKYWVDTIIPYSVFKKIREYYTCYDLCLKNSIYEEHVKRFNGTMGEFYNEEGYGSPQFDSEEDCYNFIKWFSENKDLQKG